MGILDGILGSVLGGGASGPLGSILSSILGGGQREAPEPGGGQLGGLGGLLDQLRRGGLGGAVDSWVGKGPNQPVDPDALGDALGRDQVSQWSRQSGMNENDILSQLSNLLPKAVDQATPEGRWPGANTPNPFDAGPAEQSPFGQAGTTFPPR